MKGLRSLVEKEEQIEEVICQYFSYIGMGVKKIPMTGWYDEKKRKWMGHKSDFVAVGHSDLIVLFNGRTFYVEVKAKNGTQSDKQKSFESFVRHHGCNYFICRSLDDAKSIAKAIRSL